jgi:hypothetical protein
MLSNHITVVDFVVVPFALVFKTGDSVFVIFELFLLNMLANDKLSARQLDANIKRNVHPHKDTKLSKQHCNCCRQY